MAIDILMIVSGLVILVVAADRLVLSAIRVAKVFNVSVVIIGAVIVGFGTSVPEFVVSVLAASDGNTGLAMSNVVASNTANLTLVLGVAAVVAALATKQSIVKREGLLMLVAVVALALVLVDAEVSRLEGALLVAGMIASVWLMISWAKDSDDDSAVDPEGEVVDGEKVWIDIVVGLVALAATVAAGWLLLEGVVSIGESVGLSVVMMGLITGVGTSFPELSAALAGARRGASDLVLGNVLGSNIFNSLGVAGVAALIGPGEFTGMSPVLLGVMVAAAVFAGVFAYTSQRISRVEGSILLGVFAAYLLLSLSA